MQVKNTKIETVIKLLEANKNHYENGSMAEALETAIKALEKRLPKEVVFDRVYKRCSNCGETPMYFQYNYCPYCGQKLRWSLWKEEEE